MELDFGQLVKEARGNEGEPFKLKLGDGKKAIEIHDVPARVFIEPLDFEHSSTPALMFAVLEKLFTKKDWEERVLPAFSAAPLGVVGETFRQIMDHFDLQFGSSEAAGKSEDSNESED